jgi:hypothetical protein
MGPTLSRWARFWCHTMGWHPHRTREPIGFDGASAHMRCGRCGFEGMVDSQGNLF